MQNGHFHPKPHSQGEDQSNGQVKTTRWQQMDKAGGTFSVNDNNAKREIKFVAKNDSTNCLRIDI